MSLEPFDIVSDAARWEKNRIKASARSAWMNIKSVTDKFSVPQTIVAEAAKEALFLPLYNIGKIINQTANGIGSLLLGTVKIGGKVAMLALPVPLPTGTSNLAEAGWKLGAAKDALAEKARGNPQPFRKLMDVFSGTLERVRDDPQARTATGNATAA